MGALNGGAIRPGESIPFRLLPPGGGAIGPIDDPVYLSIPFDELGGGPGSVRWAICDQGGKVIDSNDADRNATPVPWPCHTPGFLIQAHAGAFILTVENKETGKRIVGPPVQEWQYKPKSAPQMHVTPDEGVAPAATPTDEPTAAAEPPESP